MGDMVSRLTDGKLLSNAKYRCHFIIKNRFKFSIEKFIALTVNSSTLGMSDNYKCAI